MVLILAMNSLGGGFRLLVSFREVAALQVVRREERVDVHSHVQCPRGGRTGQRSPSPLCGFRSRPTGSAIGSLLFHRPHVAGVSVGARDADSRRHAHSLGQEQAVTHLRVLRTFAYLRLAEFSVRRTAGRECPGWRGTHAVRGGTAVDFSSSNSRSRRAFSRQV